jgi:glycerate kinase
LTTVAPVATAATGAEAGAAAGTGAGASFLLQATMAAAAAIKVKESFTLNCMDTPELIILGNIDVN